MIERRRHTKFWREWQIREGVVNSLIRRLQEAETRCFGRRYSDGPRELKGRALLKRKVFRHRDLDADVDMADVPALAREALDEGAQADNRMLKALALAKLDYVSSVFDICRKFNCRAFASIVETDASATTTGGLRKDSLVERAQPVGQPCPERLNLRMIQNADKMAANALAITMAETEFSLASAAAERLGGCGVIGYEVRSDADLVRAVEAGLRTDALAALSEGGVTDQEIAALVINPRTLSHRRAKGSLGPWHWPRRLLRMPTRPFAGSTGNCLSLTAGAPSTWFEHKRAPASLRTN